MYHTDKRTEDDTMDTLMLPCIEWDGYIGENGYGTVQDAGVTKFVHRFVYELCFGPIPSGLEVDHLCNNRKCMNPGHLEAVTPSENRRRAAERRTTCRRGHPRIPENIYAYGPNPGTTRCRVCRKENRR